MIVLVIVPDILKERRESGKMINNLPLSVEFHSDKIS